MTEHGTAEGMVVIYHGVPEKKRGVCVENKIYKISALGARS